MEFCDEAVYCSKYLLNKISTKEFCHVTNVKKWCGKKPCIIHLKTFGCVSWEHILEDCRKKLDAKSHSHIMMGYSKDLRSYQLFDPVKQWILIT